MIVVVVAIFFKLAELSPALAALAIVAATVCAIPWFRHHQQGAVFKIDLQTEIHALRKDNCDLATKVDKLDKELATQIHIRAAGGSSSPALRDFYCKTVRLVDRDTGGVVALERAENCRRGQPRLERHWTQDDARSHWMVMPDSDIGAGCVRVMMPITSEVGETDSMNGRGCVAHGEWCKGRLQMWERLSGGDQGWLMEHSTQGHVTLRAANAQMYIGIEGTTLVLASSPRDFRIEVVS